MTRNRKIIVLLGVLIVVVMGVEIGSETAVADDMIPRVYLPIIQRSNPTIGSPHNGIATYYNATGEGNCGFPATPDDLMVTALNEVQYDNAKWCGAFVRVTGPKDTIIVRIVDRCPECGYGHLDLSREAFAAIGDIPLGGIHISWQVVSPPIDGPISYFFHRDSHQWWMSIQIRNHRNPIGKLEYLNHDGVFVEAPRRMWNRFDISGMGSGPFTFRVTDILGNVLQDSNIPLTPDSATQGSGQFPAP